VATAPKIKGEKRFADKTRIVIEKGGNLDARYTLDGSDPTADSPLYTKPFTIRDTTIVKARSFKGRRGLAEIAEAKFYKLKMLKSAKPAGKTVKGLNYALYEGAWDNLPDFSKLKPVKKGVCRGFDLLKIKGDRTNNYGIVFEGYIKVPKSGLYEATLSSDDGSKLYIDGEPVVDNDGLHANEAKKDRIVLEKGLHRIRVEFFQLGGDIALSLDLKTPSGKTIKATPKNLFRVKK